MVLLALGGAATDLGPWYASLIQPSWKPPRAAFGPTWAVVLGLAAVAAVSAWHRAPGRTARTWIVGLFVANGVLNASWSVLFFTARRPDWALVDLVLLWLSVLVLAVYCGRYSRHALLCLLPYLAWVGFAGMLNATIVRLNGPFAPA